MNQLAPQTAEPVLCSSSRPRSGALSDRLRDSPFQAGGKTDRAELRNGNDRGDNDRNNLHHIHNNDNNDDHHRHHNDDNNFHDRDFDHNRNDRIDDSTYGNHDR